MLNTIFNFVDLLMTIGALLSVLYLLIFTVAGVRSKRICFPPAKDVCRILVLVREGSSFTRQDYPEEFYGVVYYGQYSELVDIVQDVDTSMYEMIVLLGEVTHVAPDLLSCINDAHYGRAKAVKLRLVVEGRQSFFKRVRMLYAGIDDAVLSFGHNSAGWTAAIGRTEVAFDSEWLKKNLFDEKSNIENRLLRTGYFVHYLPQACVYSNDCRMDRPTGHVLRKFFTILPGVLAEGNIFYADKLVRNALPSLRNQIRIVLLWMVVSAFFSCGVALKWFAVFTAYMILMAVAVPDDIVFHTKEKEGKG